MGEAHDRLLLKLAGTERVSGYTRQSTGGKTVRVGAYTRSPGDMTTVELADELGKLSGATTGQAGIRRSQIISELRRRTADVGVPDETIGRVTRIAPGVTRSAPSSARALRHELRSLPDPELEHQLVTETDPDRLEALHLEAEHRGGLAYLDYPRTEWSALYGPRDQSLRDPENAVAEYERYLRRVTERAAIEGLGAKLRRYMGGARRPLRTRTPGERFIG